MKKRLCCELGSIVLLLAGQLTCTGWPKGMCIVHDQSGMHLSGNDRIWEGSNDNAYLGKRIRACAR